MSNMEYCRFRNTLRDLRDCESALYRGEEPLPPEEVEARRNLIELCINIAIDHGEQVGRLVEEVDPD